MSNISRITIDQLDSQWTAALMNGRIGWESPEAIDPALFPYYMILGYESSNNRNPYRALLVESTITTMVVHGPLQLQAVSDRISDMGLTVANFEGLFTADEIWASGDAVSETELEGYTIGVLLFSFTYESDGLGL